MKLKKKLSNKTKQQVGQLANAAMHAYLNNQLGIAEQHCRKMLNTHEHNPDACNILGKIAEKRGNIDKAIAVYRQGHTHHPKHTGLLASLGLLYGKLHEHELAIQSWQRFVRLSPNNPDAWQALSAEYFNLQQWDKSVSAIFKAIKLTPKKGHLHTNLGRICRKQGQHEEAIKELQHALKLIPDDIDTWFELAMSTLENGELDEAFRIFSQLLKLDPRHVDSLSMLLRYRKSTAYDEPIKQAESLYNEPDQPANNRALLAFSLGKAWEDLMEHDKSFTWYARGNHIRRESVAFSINDEKHNAEILKSLFSRQFLSEQCAKRSGGDGLVFIVGMPRSGSTLLDRILAAHSQVIDTGETEELARTIGLLTSDNSKIIHFQNILQCSDEQIEAAADDYLARMHRFYGDSENYVNKTLPNLWLIGFIRLLFPNAKILHCTRNPLDNCFSIFSTDLEGSFFRFSYDLQELGEYYRTYIDIMNHWRTVLPADIFYEVSYEDLVTFPEEESRRLLEFCGLEWDDACLKHHTSKGSVQTSSLAQVRQPIYKSSIERWKRYEKHLQPLIDALGDAI